MTTTLVQYRLRSVDTKNTFGISEFKQKLKLIDIFHTAKRKQYKTCASQKITRLGNLNGLPKFLQLH